MSHRSPRSAFTAHLPPTRRSVLASALGLVGAGSALALTGCGGLGGGGGGGVGSVVKSSGRSSSFCSEGG